MHTVTPGPSLINELYDLKHVGPGCRRNNAILLQFLNHPLVFQQETQESSSSCTSLGHRVAQALVAFNRALFD